MVYAAVIITAPCVALLPSHRCEEVSQLLMSIPVTRNVFPELALTDDLAVLLYVLKRVWTGIDPEIIAQAREKLSKWFDEEEINEIQNLFNEEE